MSDLENRVKALEEELAIYRRIFVVTPTKVTIKKSILVEGMMNADRVYTKRNGTHVELTS